MKQIAKMLVSFGLLLAVSACASTNQNSEIFSNYEYAPAVSFNSYPGAAYGTVGYSTGAVATPFSMNNHN